MTRPSIPIPPGGFRNNHDLARWLTDSITLRMQDVLDACGIRVAFAMPGLFELLELALQGASDRAKVEAKQ